MSGECVPGPGYCLTCHQSRKCSEEEAQVDQKVIFTLRILLGIPVHLISSFLEETGNKWGFCESCAGTVEELRELYAEIWKLCGRFRERRKEVKGRWERIKKRDGQTDSWANIEQGRDLEEMEDESGFKVENVNVLTERILSGLNKKVDDSEFEESVAEEDNEEQEEMEEAIMDLEEDLEDFNEDPLSISQEDELEEKVDVKSGHGLSEENSEESDGDWEWEEPDTDTGKVNPSVQQINIETDAKSISKQFILSDNRNECLQCKRTFNRPVGLKSHLYQVHEIKLLTTKDLLPPKTWTCSEPNCTQTFTGRMAYQTHVLNHRKGEPKFKCNLCPKAYRFPKRLNLHRHDCHGLPLQTQAKRGTATCPVCQNRYVNATQLRGHIKRQHPDNQVYIPSEKYPCTWQEGCDKVFRTQEALLVHLSRHEGEPRYPCDQCDTKCYSRQERIRHKDACHSGKKFECEFCGKTFKNNQNLRFHRNKWHGVQKRRYLTEKKEKSKRQTVKNAEKDSPTKSAKNAEKGSPRKSVKNIQENTQRSRKSEHDSELRFFCEFCGKVLTSNSNLLKHQFIVHKDQGKMYRCGVVGCRQFFVSQEGLEEHTKRDHGESGQDRRYQCAHCGKGFHSRWKFEQHEMAHANKDIKPFKCGLCDKGFANQHNLKYHELYTHKLEKRKGGKKPRNTLESAQSQPSPLT